MAARVRLAPKSPPRPRWAGLDTKRGGVAREHQGIACRESARSAAEPEPSGGALQVAGVNGSAFEAPPWLSYLLARRTAARSTR
jgi:hypothetical protein